MGGGGLGLEKHWARVEESIFKGPLHPLSHKKTLAEAPEEDLGNKTPDKKTSECSA